MNILFVCTANVCRSVMAEALFRQTAGRHPSAEMPHVASAGIDALVDAFPDDCTSAVCLTHRLDVSRHQGRQLTESMIDHADLVLCLAEDHKRLILSAYPRFKGKVFLLLEYGQSKAPKKLSIDDPTGRAMRKYEACFKKIEEEVTRVYRLTLTPAEGTMPIIPVSL